jgi:hypothetical protein
MAVLRLSFAFLGLKESSDTEHNTAAFGTKKVSVGFREL